MTFETETGSIYILDKGTMGWCRQFKTELSGAIRQEFGTLIAWPTLEVGQPAYLQDSKPLAGGMVHYVVTSRVTWIHEEKPQ